MRNQKGFIQIPLLIAIIAGVLVLGGGGYLGIKQYQSYRTEQQKIAQEKERQTRELLETQKKFLEEQQKAIEEQNQTIGELQGSLQKSKQDIEQIQTQENTKTSEDISRDYIPLSSMPETFARMVVMIICQNTSSGVISIGSGTIFGSNKYILTNNHVINNMETCQAGITDDMKKTPSRWFDVTASSKISSVDMALLKSVTLLSNALTVSEDFICSSADISIGDKVTVLGYPTLGGSTITATEGIVSGFDGYYVKTSAKIEHGNSGGGAFLTKPKTPIQEIKSCWFGIPTSVRLGELESLGYIINYSLLHEASQ